MKYGIFSGALWGLDTVVLSMALVMLPFLGAPEAAMASALLHDVLCAIILLHFLFNLALTLMVSIVIIRAGDGSVSVMVSAEYDGDESAILSEVDPYAL